MNLKRLAVLGLTLACASTAMAESRFGPTIGMWDVGSFNALTVGAFYNYDINDYFGIEGAAQYYAEDKSDSVEIDGFGLLASANGYLPVSDKARLIGQLGLSYLDVDASVSFGGFSASASDSDTQLFWGLGGEMDIDERWTVRLMYQGHDSDGSTFKTFNVGLGVRF